MNREFQQLMAYQNSVKAARFCHKPLGIWPSERHFVNIEDLPVIIDSPTPPTQIFTVRSSSELQSEIQIGKSYALIVASPDAGGNFQIGEW